MTKCKHVLLTLVVLEVLNYFTGIPAVAAISHTQVYGETCDERLQCQENERMFCDDMTRTCSCHTGTVPSSDKEKCLKVAPLNGECEENLQCTDSLGPHSACYDKRCLCNADAIPVADVCEKNPTATDLACKVDTQCSEVFGDDAVCANSACDCKAGTHMDKGRRMCINDIGLGDECNSDHDCYLPMNGKQQHVRCANNFCKCKQGYSPSDANKICTLDDASTSASYLATPLQSTILIGVFLYISNKLFAIIF